MLTSLSGIRPRPRDVRAAGVFEWSFYWHRRRLRGATVLGALPVLLALLVAVLKLPPLEWVEVRSADVVPHFFSFTYLLVLVVVLPLLLGTSLVSREVEARTLPYLLVRPLARGSLLVGKFLGAWFVACALLCGSFVIALVVLLAADGFAAAAEPLRELPAYLLTLCVGALAYTALFTTVGLVSPRPALLGFFLGFLWELAIPFLPGLIRNLTVRHHLVSLVPDRCLPHVMQRVLAVSGPVEAMGWLIGGAVFFVAVAAYVFANRDYA